MTGLFYFHYTHTYLKKLYKSPVIICEYFAQGDQTLRLKSEVFICQIKTITSIKAQMENGVVSVRMHQGQVSLAQLKKKCFKLHASWLKKHSLKSPFTAVTMEELERNIAMAMTRGPVKDNALTGKWTFLNCLTQPVLSIPPLFIPQRLNRT